MEPTRQERRLKRLLKQRYGMRVSNRSIMLLSELSRKPRKPKKGKRK